jgi:hypothetical protein
VTSRIAAAALAAAALAFAGVAAASALSDAQLRYRQERAACLSGGSNQDRATCLREAGAALAEARHGGLATGGDRDLVANRAARCNALPAADREDCTMRMEGAGTTSGSAQQGGVLRELTRPVPTR